MTAFRAGRRRLIMSGAAALLACAARSAVPANALKPFRAESMRGLRDTHAGRPFVLALWSVHCAPCLEDLPLWNTLRAAHPGVPIELVSADDAGEAGQVVNLLARYGSSAASAWIFADAVAERVRFAIDRTWRGELPRTYFFDAQHSREVVTGRIDPAFASAWFARMAERTATK